MASDLEIARSAQLEPIETIAWKLGIPSGELNPYGQHMAKLTWDGMKQRCDSSIGNLIGVTSGIRHHLVKEKQLRPLD